MSVFKQIESTRYAHRNNTVIPSYRNQPFITGSGKNHNVKTEIFDLRKMQWITADDYPFTKMNIEKKLVYFLKSPDDDRPVPWCLWHGLLQRLFFFVYYFRIYGYAATWTDDEVFIFGGWYSKNDKRTIAKYSNGVWSNVGDLIQGRYSHAAISHNGVTLIIGGSTDNGQP